MAQEPPGAVLVVEDHDDSRSLYVAALTLAGFRCHAAAAPDKAMRLATTIRFDGVVIDLGLPRLADGLALAWRLSALAEAPRLIAVSGQRLPAPPPMFSTFLLKPVDPDDLVDTVRRIITARG